MPGTGKTATVHAAIRELHHIVGNAVTTPGSGNRVSDARYQATNSFTYVEINGLRLPEPAAAYNILWEAVSDHDVTSNGHLKISSKEALKQLSKRFSAGVRVDSDNRAW